MPLFWCLYIINLNNVKVKKIYQLFIVLSLPLSLVLFSYVSGSPGGKTGSPGDGGATCTECHSGTATPQSAWITSNIPSEGYTPGETYQITASGVHQGVVKFGFELTSENLTGNKTGTFNITDATRTHLSNGGKSVTHTSTGTAPTGGAASWTVNWTAPASGDVFFYGAFNAANGNGNNSGDVIYTSSLSVSEWVLNPAITGITPDHVQPDFVGELSIAGMDTDWSGGVTTVLFINHDDPGITFDALDVTIQNNTSLLVSISVPAGFPIGVYDVQVDDLTLENGFEIDQLNGLESVNQEINFQVYPVPATDYLYVNADQEAVIRVLDLQGKTLMNYVSTQKTSKIDINDLKSGMYLLSVAINGEQTSKKWIKN